MHHPLVALLAAPLALFSSLVHAQSSCITTKTISTTVTAPDTTYLVKTKTSTTTQFIGVSWTDLGTTTVTSPSTAYITSASTTILNSGTRTLGQYKFVTKSCPPGPSYVLRCPKFTSTVTEHETSTSWIGTVTSTLTSTDVIYVDQTTTVVKSTVTTGSPPTTKVVTSTQTQVTSTFSYRTTITKTVGTVTSTYRPQIVLVTTHTTSLPSPTATATLHLFSLQITNTTNTVDGFTWGQRGEKAVIQNATIWRYYIDPATGFLKHAPSGNYLAYTSCDGEECLPPLTFVRDQPRPAFDGISGPLPMSCSGGCGKLLQCWDTSNPPSEGGSYLAIDAMSGYELGVQFGINYDGSWLNLRLVGPTRGR